MHENSTISLTPTRQHFEILDGLRGIAAIAVVIFHFMEIAVPDYNNSFIAHAYLSVDFFFCLSGFVIAYAYDDRLQKIGTMAFLKLRLIRLHPLVIIASVVGLIVFVLDPFSQLWMKYAARLPLMFVASCLMIPYPLVHERYFNLFHLNPPTWSLFWEYIANILYALVLVRLRNKWLWALVGLGAIALYFEAQASGFLGVGWGGDNFRGGGVRVAFSFVAGMLVYRSRWIIRHPFGFAGIGTLLAMVFIIPYSNTYNKIIDPTIVVFFLPLLVALGAGATLHNRAKAICRFSGNISYPLYMIHYPFIWLFMSYVEKQKPSLTQMLVITAAGTLLLIGLAYFVFAYLDEPLRKWFRKKS
ncbi:acyltransferase [Chitinophaga horti]|uniref:Acyltransferase n=1 Tax=Chitinophaga horti TaxID=2920382 RepID=A0ABY6IZA7_9BACT|nr:acyltransferase [Chitinophaga horti]UYQ91466.1 acyltransferase [Chitinophaga horti]